jgi:hypothetical protein
VPAKSSVKFEGKFGNKPKQMTVEKSEGYAKKPSSGQSPFNKTKPSSKSKSTKTKKVAKKTTKRKVK